MPPPVGRSAGAPVGLDAYRRGRPAPSAMPWGGRPRSPPGPLRRPLSPGRHPPRRHPPGFGAVVTRFGTFDTLPTRLDTTLMPGRRVRSRPHGRLSAARAALGLPSTGHRRSDQARSASTRSVAAHVADRSARGQPAIASSPARADRLRDPGTHPATPAQFPPAHCARGPIAAHTIDGFLISGSGTGLDF